MTRAGTRIIVDDTRVIGRGGEAAVLAVEGNDSKVAKLYHSGFATSTRREKLRVMLDHPPNGSGSSGVAWPTDELTDTNGNFCGFIMPRVSRALLLHELADPKDRLTKAPTVTPRFLLGVVRNLATAIAAVHTAGHIIGDLNANNVCIDRTGLVTLVDCDSFEVHGNGRRFPCVTGMPDLQPPEILQALAKPGASFATVTRTTSSDCWILGLLCYSLLTDGEDATNALITQSQPGFLGLHTIPEPLRRLTERMLSAAPNARPSAREWSDAAKRSIGLLVPCATNGERHAHAKHLFTCPYCVRAKAIGLDTFGGPPIPQSQPTTPTPVRPAPSPKLQRVVPAANSVRPANVGPPLRVYPPVVPLRAPRRSIRKRMLIAGALVFGAHALLSGTANRALSHLGSLPVVNDALSRSAWSVLPSRYATRLIASPAVIRARALLAGGDTTDALAALREGWTITGHRDARTLLLAGELNVERNRSPALSARLLAAAINEHLQRPFLTPSELADAFDALAVTRCSSGDFRGYRKFSSRASQLRETQNRTASAQRETKRCGGKAIANS